MTTKHNRKLTLGAILWVLNLQYFIVQFVTATAWRTVGYSWRHNTISDLANTQCGPYGSRFVCSPLHVLMNGSFIAVGLTIISGALFLQRELASDYVGRLGFWCMACAGVGAVLIGIAPENAVSIVHIIGAGLSFLLGNIGMLLLAFRLRWLPKPVRACTFLAGVLGLTALPLFLGHSYAGVGIGGMERIVAYPQTLWMIAFGLYLLLSPKALNSRHGAGTISRRRSNR